jgi:hypothetical protein
VLTTCGSVGISSALSSPSSYSARTRWCRSTIVEDLWGAEPPASATKSVHALISKLRRRLEGDAADDANGETGENGVLLTRPHGYVSDRLAEGGWWCYEAGPAADYRWTVSGTALTLSPQGGADRCGIRGFIWAGEWERLG